jgi:hypothetical protein
MKLDHVHAVGAFGSASRWFRPPGRDDLPAFALAFLAKNSIPCPPAGEFLDPAVVNQALANESPEDQFHNLTTLHHLGLLKERPTQTENTNDMRINHVSGATTFGHARAPRQGELPMDVCDILDRVRLPHPAPGERVSLRQLDGALAGQPVETRFRVKKALNQAGLL